jgi:uncharacterized membrane protein (Fun14 family)
MVGFATVSHEDHTPAVETTAPPWRKKLVLALIVLVGVSVAGRAYYQGKHEERLQEAKARQQETPRAANALLPGQTPPTDEPEVAEEEKSGLEALLPFLTEGGIAMLLGIALGVATRSIFRIVLILLAVVFVSIQFLAYKGLIADVDWGGIASTLKNFVLHIPETTGLSRMLQYKLPSAGSLVLGFYLGLKRG